MSSIIHPINNIHKNLRLSLPSISLPSEDITKQKKEDLSEAILFSDGYKSINQLFNDEGDSERKEIHKIHKWSGLLKFIVRELDILSKKQPYEPSIKKLTDNNFHKLYDKRLKTFASFIPKNFDGIPLLACASQELKENEQESINIILLDLFSDQSRIIQKDNDFFLVVKSGCLIDKEKNIHIGDFPNEVFIDLVDHTGNGKILRTLFKELNIPMLNNIEIMKITRDKSATKEYILKNTDFTTPPYLNFKKEENRNIKELEKKIKDFIKLLNVDGFVIKPISESSGRGVKLFKNNEIEAGSKHLLEIINKYKFAMLEKRVKSYPYYNNNLKKLDWNIRVLAAQEGIIDLEARVDSWSGRPINKAKGAWIEEVSSVLDKVGLSNERNNIISKINHISLELVKKLEAGFIGVDLILDENLEINIIEINSGAVGGLISLAEIREEENQLSAPKKFISLLSKSLKVKPKNDLLTTSS